MAIREMQDAGQKLSTRWLRDAALVSLGLSLFLGLIGPLGDYVLFPLEHRLLSWTVIGMSGFCIFAGLLIVLDRFKSNWSWLNRLIISSIVGSVFLTPIVMTFDRLITGDETGGLLGTYFTVLLIGSVYMVFFEAIRIYQRDKISPNEGRELEKNAKPPLFMRHLPEKLEGSLLCLSKEDHYLRIYTESGDCLIRFRMSDAVAELSEMHGQQTHRSWWVADQAVISAKKRPTGGANATLSNGLVVPIARARIADAQAAGWFDRS